jgi:hypothetical protein
VTTSAVNMAEKESTMSDSLVFEAVEFGRALADICTRVNRRQIEAVEAKLAEEVGERFANKAAEIRPRRSVSPMMPTV